jgi:flagellar export protein FliJ
MTTFKFRLERVLDYRRTQFQMAESQYRLAGAKLHEIRIRRAALANRKLETRKIFAQLTDVAGQDLASLPDWYRWTEITDGHLHKMEQAAAQELHNRRAALIDAQRKVKLLEKLRDHRRTQWQADFDRELEELASDSTNSRYAREAQPVRPAETSRRSPSHPSGGNGGPETCT